MIEIVAFARAFPHAGKYRIAAVRLGDVVDEFLDDHRLAHAGAAEQADLAAARIRCEQIDDLDPGDENLRLGRLLRIGRRRLVDGTAFLVRHRTGLVDRLSDDVDDAAERAVPDRDRNRQPGIGNLLSADETFARIHGNGAHGRFAEMLGDFEHQAIAVIVRLQRIENRGQISLELHIDDGADDLGDVSDFFRHSCPLGVRTGL